MPKTVIKNTSAGPRFFNTQNGGQVTLRPGESAELDLMVEPDKDKALLGMKDRGEIQIGQSLQKMQAQEQQQFDPAALAEAQQRLMDAQQEVDRLLGMRATAELDVSRRTPPRQLGGDGGPEQTGTVDGSAGAPTGAQGEGTPEQKSAAADSVTTTNPPPPKPPEQKPPEPEPQSSSARRRG